jgi:hypothetical protein
LSTESPTRGKSLRLKRPYLWTVYATAWGVWLTGALWLVFHYFFRVRGQFGFRANPMEAVWIAAHGGLAAASLFMFGLLWVSHVLAGWHMRWRRWSGGTLAGVTIWLTLTGYALYYIGGSQTLAWVQILHWTVGLAALAAFFIHWLSKSSPR